MREQDRAGGAPGRQGHAGAVALRRRRQERERAHGEDPEWLWYGDAKKSFAWQMKVLDWRPVADVEEPDIVAFVSSAIGEGRWPPGSAAKEDPKGGKDPKKPPKKK